MYDDIHGTLDVSSANEFGCHSANKFRYSTCFAESILNKNNTFQIPINKHFRQ